MKPKHKWKKVNNYDRLWRKCIYCPACDALALSEEVEFIDLLNKKGCSLINTPSEIFVKTHAPLVSFFLKLQPSVLSIKEAIKQASHLTNYDVETIWFENNKGRRMELEKEIDF